MHSAISKVELERNIMKQVETEPQTNKTKENEYRVFEDVQALEEKK